MECVHLVCARGLCGKALPTTKFGFAIFTPMLFLDVVAFVWAASLAIPRTFTVPGQCPVSARSVPGDSARSAIAEDFANVVANVNNMYQLAIILVYLTNLQNPR